MSDLVGNPEDRFSHNEAHMIYTLNNDGVCVAFIKQVMSVYIHIIISIVLLFLDTKAVKCAQL